MLWYFTEKNGYFNVLSEKYIIKFFTVITFFGYVFRKKSKIIILAYHSLPFSSKVRKEPSLGSLTIVTSQQADVGIDPGSLHSNQ